MSVCIGVMFVTVVVCAILIGADWLAVARGLVWPTIPDWQGEGLRWTVGLMGGVGGTLTILCYGYWIREKDLHGTVHLPTVRMDLMVAYAMTAGFGIAMLILGSQLELPEGKGALLVVGLADQLESKLGAVGRWVFLLGAWGAIFSSLFGVWQSVPYLFADFWRMTFGDSSVAVSTKSRTYLLYLFAIASVPALGLRYDFAQVQLVYAVIGALFMPMLALVLLLLNGSRDRIGAEHRNGWATTGLLVLCLVFFGATGLADLWGRLQ